MGSRLRLLAHRNGLPAAGKPIESMILVVRRSLPDLPGLPHRPEFLPELREHRSRTLSLIGRAEHSGHRRVAEMNSQILTKLDRMIGAVAQHDEPGTHAG
jgi:hypothetical protein